MQLIIKNGKIYDGAGNPYYYADIGIDGGKIAKIGKIDARGKTIDAKRKIVCPGIIDSHSHSDWTILQNKRAESALRQGVTTEVVGNCGFSSAPLNNNNIEFIKANMRSYAPDVKITWRNFEEYLRTVNKARTGINIVCLTGHGTLRRAVLGKEDRKATDAEINRMAAMLSESLDQGSAGLSTGLEFMPGRLADKRELIGLLKIVAKKGKVHACHMRNRDRFFKEAADEILDVTKKTGAQLIFSHLSAKPGSKKDDFGKIISKIEALRSRGFNITTDMIVYQAGPGLLCNILPGWVFQGGTSEAVKRLRDREIIKKLKGQCNRYWLLVEKKEWDKLSLSGCVSHPELLGKTFRQISNIMGKPVLECIFEILADEGEGMPSAMMNGVLFSKSHMKEMLSQKFCALASDSNTSEITGPTSKFANHPSIFGWVPRALSYYVKKEKLFPMEEAIRKITSFPAAVYNLKGRGLIKEGMTADIAIFDENKIKEEVDFKYPKKYSSSFAYTIISGEIAVEKAKLKNAALGRVLIR